jgi:hypothetical protein
MPQTGCPYCFPWFASVLPGCYIKLRHYRFFLHHLQSQNQLVNGINDALWQRFSKWGALLPRRRSIVLTFFPERYVLYKAFEQLL